MKLVYGISRWNNANRARARHIDNGDGLPLCGAKAFTFERDEGDPTCAKCKRLYDAPMLTEPYAADDQAQEDWLTYNLERDAEQAEYRAMLFDE